MRNLLLVAMLLSSTAFAGDNACDVVRPHANPGETLVNVKDQCYALTQQELAQYMRRLTGVSDPCAKARKQLTGDSVLAILPSGSCVTMSRTEVERQIARASR